MTELLDTIEIETAPNPTASVFLLHGFGADAQDLASLVNEFDLTACPAIRFIFPNAPFKKITAFNGYETRAWYDILSQNMFAQEDETGIHASEQAIQALLEREQSRGIASNQIVLGGFSQGCAMTLQTGLRYTKPLAGLLCLSGYLPLADTVDLERNPANQHTPIFMGHGEEDNVVPIPRAFIAKEKLAALGYQVDFNTYPMQHAIHPVEIKDISLWLAQVLTTN